MKRLKKWLTDLIFPPRCVVCGEVLKLEERTGFLCGSCAAELPYLPKGKCPHCGERTEEAGFCEFCVEHSAFHSACAVFPYETVRKAIRLFKYGGDRTIGYGLGGLMAEYLQEHQKGLLEQTDLMTSVPLHPKKEKFRGFNQTHILCERIAEKTGLPFDRTVLERKRETLAQNRLNHEERKVNLHGAFVVRTDVMGKRMLLVDDIFTTGTTCNECARELYRAGAKEVYVCTLSAAGKN